MHSRTIEKSLLSDERGANFMEYIILLALVAVLAMAGFQAFGTSIMNKVTEGAGTVDGLPMGGQ